MNKHILTSIICLLTSIAAEAKSKNHPCHTKSGLTTCDHIQLESFKGSGHIIFNHTQINGFCSIKGVLKSQESQLNQLIAFGHVELTASTIHQNAIITGHLNLKNSDTKALLKIYGNQATLTNSNTQSIEMSNSHSSPTLYLNEQTTVHGDINFTDTAGTVVLGKQASILGKIINGNQTQAL